MALTVTIKEGCQALLEPLDSNSGIPESDRPILEEGTTLEYHGHTSGGMVLTYYKDQWWELNPLATKELS